MLTRSTRRIFKVLGGACLVLALMPGLHRSTTHRADGSSTTDTLIRLGLPFSPLVNVDRIWTETPMGQQGKPFLSFRQSADVHVLSASCALLVVGLFLVTWRNRGRGLVGA